MASTSTVEADGGEGLRELLSALAALIARWEDDVQGYPGTVEGRYARAAVTLCAQELRETIG